MSNKNELSACRLRIRLTNEKKKDWRSFSNALIYCTGAMEGTMRFTATDRYQVSFAFHELRNFTVRLQRYSKAYLRY